MYVLQTVLGLAQCITTVLASFHNTRSLCMSVQYVWLLCAPVHHVIPLPFLLTKGCLSIILS